VTTSAGCGGSSFNQALLKDFPLDRDGEATTMRAALEDASAIRAQGQEQGGACAELTRRLYDVVADDIHTLQGYGMSLDDESFGAQLGFEAPIRRHATEAVRRAQEACE
jgi:hypothetical protein